MAALGSSSPPKQSRIQSTACITSEHFHNTKHRRNSASSSKRPSRPAFKREKPRNSSKKRVSIEDPEQLAFEDQEDMTTSFPQFCTFCERQIVTPNSTILYCSESCRRRDMNKPLASSMPSTNHLHTRPTIPAQGSMGRHLEPARDIIPQKSPTITSNRFSFTDLFTAGNGSELEEEIDTIEDNQVKLDQPRHHRRQESEAARYLRQFQSPSFIAESSMRPVRRPNPQSRSSTYSLAPSLTHSPSPGTSPSSFSALSSLPLAYSRPLPPRANPYSRSYGAKGMSLVTPQAGAQSVPQHVDLAKLPGLKAQPSLSTNVGVDDLPDELPIEGLKYEKKTIIGSAPRESKGALRSLFRFDDMQAPPT